MQTHLVSEGNDSLSSDSIYSSSEDDSSSNEIENHLMESVLKTDHVRFRNKKYEKWMSSVLNAKMAMLSSEWSNLLTAIQALEKALKSIKSNSLVIFTPILARFLLELDEFLKKSPIDKKYRKNLKSGEAKACNVAQQKSQQLIKSFNSLILEYQKNPPPIPISSSNISVVDAIEKFLMIPPHNYLSLRNLNLHEYPQYMKEINDTIKYYKSFSRTVDNVPIELDLLTILDLSRNKLQNFPYEILLFKNLKVLCISNNLFRYFPPYITRLARKTVILGVKANPLMKSNVYKFQMEFTNINNEDIPRLMDICAQTIILKKIPLKRRKPKFITNSSHQIVPDIIVNFIQEGFLCESCLLFISSASSLFLPPIIEYMKFSWKLDEDPDYQQISTASDLTKSANIPLFRRFCVKCWKKHNGRKNSSCSCITCKVEKRRKNSTCIILKN